MPKQFYFPLFILTGNFISLKSNLSLYNMPIFLIFAGWRFAECKYLTKHHFKYSLIFWILIKPTQTKKFLYVWYNCSIDWFKYIIMSVSLNQLIQKIYWLKKIANLFLIANSVPCSCSSGLKDFKIWTL